MQQRVINPDSLRALTVTPLISCYVANLNSTDLHRALIGNHTISINLTRLVSKALWKILKLLHQSSTSSVRRYLFFLLISYLPFNLNVLNHIQSRYSEIMLMEKSNTVWHCFLLIKCTPFMALIQELPIVAIIGHNQEKLKHRNSSKYCV